MNIADNYVAMDSLPARKCAGNYVLLKPPLAVQTHSRYSGFNVSYCGGITRALLFDPTMQNWPLLSLGTPVLR